jgi:hypothetical protein
MSTYLAVDFCSSVERGQAFQALDCHIYHEYRILNRVAYIRDGKAHKGRQIQGKRILFLKGRLGKGFRHLVFMVIAP